MFLAGVFPFVASDYWLGISIDALVAVVGSVAMMILTGFAGQVSLGHGLHRGGGVYRSHCREPVGGHFGWLHLSLA